MKNNTAMEELIIKLKNSSHIISEECADIIELATELLEKEKRIIVDAFDDARKKQTETVVTGENKDDCFYVITNKFENGEQYYSQTFKKD